MQQTTHSESPGGAQHGQGGKQDRVCPAVRPNACFFFAALSTFNDMKGLDPKDAKNNKRTCSIWSDASQEQPRKRARKQAVDSVYRDSTTMRVGSSPLRLDSSPKAPQRSDPTYIRKVSPVDNAGRQSGSTVGAPAGVAVRSITSWPWFLGRPTYFESEERWPDDTNRV